MKVLLPLTIILFPFANLFHVLFPAFILGKSAWIVLPVATIFISYIYLFIGDQSKPAVFEIGVFLLIFVSFILFYVRWFIYKESSNVLDIRFVWTSLIFLALAVRIRKVPRLVDSIAFGVIGQGVLTAIGRIINFYFFPYVMISRAEDDLATITTEGQLTRDLLMASSISGNQIICGMVTFIVVYSKYKSRFSSIHFIVVQSIMTIGVLNTMSRYPIILSALLLFVSFLEIVKNIKKQIFTLLVYIFGVFMICVNTNIIQSNFFARFFEDSGARGVKLVIAFQLVLNSAVDFLIGSPSQTIVSSNIDGVDLSDNSYSLIAVTLGCPFMVLYFFAIISQILKTGVQFISRFMQFYLILGFGITNCVLWEPWVFTAFITAAIVKHYSRPSDDKRVNSNRAVNRMVPNPN